MIVALVSQNGGAPARALRVASYKAPKPQRLSRPGGLRVKRKKRKITVSWHRVSGAVRYQVLLLLSDRSEVFRVTRSSKIRFADPFQYRSGKVLVAAVGADGSRSPLATKPIKKRKLKKRR